MQNKNITILRRNETIIHSFHTIFKLYFALSDNKAIQILNVRFFFLNLDSTIILIFRKKIRSLMINIKNCLN